MKKKNGKNVYEKKVTLGRDANGIPIRKSFTGRTIAELNQRIEDAKQTWMAMHDITEGIYFKTYADRWLNNTKAVRSLNTKRMYRDILKNHLVPEIGDLYFSEISLSDLQRIINERADRYETCNKIRLTIRQIYNSASDEGLVKNVNVKKLVLPPKPKSEKRALTESEKEALFLAEFPEMHKIFVKLLYYTGIRKEEALALEVSDIENGMLNIDKVIVFDENDPVLQRTTKSSASTRKVPIPSDFLQELTAYASTKEKCLFEQPRFNGKYISKSSYRKFWNTITDAMSKFAPSSTTLTAHIFRHNYATMLYYSNVSVKMAAKLMGHEGTQMIMQIYAHLDEQRENTAEKLDAVFQRKTPQPQPECSPGV
jgi:integrase